MNLKIYFGTQQPFTLLVAEDATVEDLRREISNKLSLPAQEVRMVCKGKILQQDEFQLSQYGVASGANLYVSKQPQQIQTSPIDFKAAAQAKSPDTELMSQLAGNPFMKAMLSNPDTMHAILMANPQMKELAEKNPDLAHMFKSRKFLEEMSETMSNPSRMKEMMRNADTAMARLDTIPGGFDALRRLHEMTRSEKDYVDERARREQDRKDEELSKRLNVGAVPQDRINDVPLPNPWAAPPESSSNTRPSFQQPVPQLPAQMPMFRPTFDPSAIFQQIPFRPPAPVVETASAAPSVDYKVKYASQLQQMKDMGFTDEEKNLKALLAAGGRLESAIDFLMTSL